MLALQRPQRLERILTECPGSKVHCGEEEINNLKSEILRYEILNQRNALLTDELSY